MALALGYLVKRRNGRYAVRYRKAGGKWTHEGLGTAKAAEAKIKFELWKQERIKIRFANLHHVAPVRLKNLAEEHLVNVLRHQSASWHEKQRHYILRGEKDRPDSPQKILQWFGENRLSTEITPNEIRDYVAYLRDNGLKAVTCNKVLSCLKAMLRFGEERGYVAEGASPARRVKLLKSDSEVHDAFLTFEQYELVKTKAKERRLGERKTLFANRLEWLVLACNTGLRPGEQTMLEFSDIDLVHGFIHVQGKPDLGFHIKNYQDRYIPLSPEARTAIEAMGAGRKRCAVTIEDGRTLSIDFVFHRPDGMFWGDLAESMDRLFESAGFNGPGTKRRSRITLHSLRHTFASWLAIAGVSLRRIQELLGHKSVVTTERYSHLGANGFRPYYADLAKAVTRGFVTTLVTSPTGPGQGDTTQVVEETGGGAQTRTADLGIMRPSL